jgi:hypothetical protein
MANEHQEVRAMITRVLSWLETDLAQSATYLLIAGALWVATFIH